ncbi:MAG: hypothetical protein U0166_01490 [Acidobacteriota bacterium]
MKEGDADQLAYEDRSEKWWLIVSELPDRDEVVDEYREDASTPQVFQDRLDESRFFMVEFGHAGLAAVVQWVKEVLRTIGGSEGWWIDGEKAELVSGRAFLDADDGVASRWLA